MSDLSSSSLLPLVQPPKDAAQIKAANAAAGRTDADRWLPWTGATQQIAKLPVHDLWAMEWVAYLGNPRGGDTPEDLEAMAAGVQEKLRAQIATPLAQVQARWREVAAVLTHPDDRVVAAAVQAWLPPLHVLRGAFFEVDPDGGANYYGRARGPLDYALADEAITVLRQILALLHDRLAPWRTVNLDGPLWSPVLDVVLEHPPLEQLLVRQQQGQPLRTPLAEQDALPAPLTTLGGAARVTALLERAGSLESAFLTVESAEARRQLLRLAPTIDAGMVARVLSHQPVLMGSGELVVHPGLSSDGVRLLIQDAILALAQNWTSRFSNFMTGFYAAGRQLDMADLLQLKVLYLQGPRVKGRATAIAQVRELVADAELGEPLVKAMTPARFADHLRTLPPEIWAAAIGEEVTRQLTGRGQGDWGKTRAALAVASAHQRAAVRKHTVRQLLLSADADVRLLGTQLMTQTPTEPAPVFTAPEAPAVALPALKRPRRGR